jgi:hypothetical protein
VKPKDYVIAFGIWFTYTAVDLLYGTLSQLFVVPALGEYNSHIINVAMLIGLIVGLTYLFINSLRVQYYKKTDFLFIGTSWLVLSILTKFGYSRYFGGSSWEQLIAEIDFSKGRLWALVLLAELIAPFIFGAVRLNRHYKRRIRRSYR